MFLHLSVCPGGGLCLSAGIPPPPLGSRHPPGAGTTREQAPPSTPSRRLLLRTVRILLESKERVPAHPYPSPRPKIFSISCGFLEKFWLNRRLALPPGGLAPPSMRNPGSAPATLSAHHSVRKKDQRCRPSMVTESFGVNRPLCLTSIVTT